MKSLLSLMFITQFISLLWAALNWYGSSSLTVYICLNASQIFTGTTSHGWIFKHK